MARTKFSNTDYGQSSNRPRKQGTEGGLPFSRADLSLLGSIARADEKKLQQAPRLDPGHGNSVKLTKACKTGRHGHCYSKTCECSCGHGGPSSL